MWEQMEKYESFGVHTSCSELKLARSTFEDPISLNQHESSFLQISTSEVENLMLSVELPSFGVKDRAMSL